MHDPIGKILRFLPAVGDVQERRPGGGAYVSEDRQQAITSVFIQGAHGFIQEDDPGFVDDRPGKGEALALAAGETPGLALEEVFDPGEIEIGVSADGPDVVEEPKVSGTGRSKESPVVGGLSEVSGVTITEIIAGADVKAKGIRMPSEIGVFVDTGRPPGRLLGG